MVRSRAPATAGADARDSISGSDLSNSSEACGIVGSGSNDLTGTSPVDSGATLKADTWTLSESGPSGYTASQWVCVGGTQSGSTISVGLAGEPAISTW